MNQKTDTSYDSTEAKYEAIKQAREDAKEVADSVDHLSDFLLIVEWEYGRYDQALTITYEPQEMGGQGWEVIKTDNGDVLKNCYLEDFEAALKDFKSCLDKAEKNDSVFYA